MSEQIAIQPFQKSWVLRVGKWWFENRSLSPVPLFLLIFALRPDFEISLMGILSVLMGVLLAESLRVWAVGYAGSSTRTRRSVVTGLVVSGPYRFIRNPLYLANILMYSATGILFGFAGLTIVIFLSSCVQYAFIVAYEEDLLHATFGFQYDSYLKAVPRWIPRKVLPPADGSCPFSLLPALRSERSTFYSIAGMGILFLIKTLWLAL